MTDSQTLEFTSVRRMLNDVQSLVSAYEGQDPNVEVPNRKEQMARQAEVNRNLLYAAQLCDNARLEILNQYHVFKGQASPRVTY